MRARDFGLVVLVGVSVTACSRGVSARMPVASPVSSLALDIPDPPARTLVPVIVEVPEPPSPEPSTPAPPARARETPAPPRPAPAQPSTTAQPPTAAPAAEPAAVLQTSANVALIEQRTTQVLASAQKNLDRLQPATLSANARASYEQARGFIKMAQDALKIKNYMYAEQLANKAADVATLLVK